MRLFEKQERFHPCGGFDLQSVVPKVIPVVQFGFMKAGLVMLGLGIYQNWGSFKRDEISNPPNYYVRLVCWIGYGFDALLTDVFAFVLWKACRNKNPAFIRVWLVGASCCVIFALCIMFLNIARLSWVEGVSSPLAFALTAGYGFIQCYIFYVVYYYLKEMEADLEMTSGQRTLTDAEIGEFENGLEPEPFRTQDLDTKTKHLMDTIHYQRYKKEDFEVLPDHFQYDKENKLGSGDYGKVYKGQLIYKDGSIRTVAVKTVDPDHTDVICFKALLIELKVMTYIGGSHPNIVTLLGASTVNIRERRLLILSEFCSNGNLHTFLRGSRPIFQNMVKNGVICKDPENNLEKVSNNYTNVDQISTLDLMRWSREIASGMEFLGFMKVIHGDLASRNILLTADKVCKISDFGLARQLYNYSVYIKKQSTPLPWRSLSLEALADMHFSEFSDIWAYGVTLWELFSLGEVPYAGYNFCLEFIYDLKAGLRPSRPSYAPDIIWEVMEQCWKSEPTSRIPFSEIVHKLINFN